VGSRTGLDNLERRKILPLLGLNLPPLSLPAHSQLLYPLHYPSFTQQTTLIIAIKITTHTITILINNFIYY
jgi:hypothetical protein